MFAKDYWQSKALYEDISKVIPNFKNIEPGQTLSIKDGSGNVSYKIMTRPSATPSENLKNGIDDIAVNGNPNSTMTMIARNGLYVGAALAWNIMDTVLKAGGVDITKSGQHDFDLCLSDVANGQFHWLRVNHKQGKLESVISNNVELNDKGDVVQLKGVISKDMREMFKSQEFKDNFLSLNRQGRG